MLFVLSVDEQLSLSDFAGIIYNEFDIDNVEASLLKTLEKWMRFEKIVDIG